jgi:hypothetical protein
MADIGLLHIQKLLQSGLHCQHVHLLSAPLVAHTIADTAWFLRCLGRLQAILSKHLARLNNSDITQMVGDSLTDITLELYSAVLEKLPPTPSRFHYVFNLRDLSRVYEGLLRSCSDVIQEPWQFLRLWRNEVRCAASVAHGRDTHLLSMLATDCAHRGNRQ